MRPRALAFVLIAGLLFGYGLALSTMIRPEVVLSFLRFQDFGLLLVLGGAAGVTLLAYRFAPRLMRKPLAGDAFGVHPSVLNARTLGGAAIFGVGWGLGGYCPGPAIVALGFGGSSAWGFVAAMIVGVLLGEATSRARTNDEDAPRVSAC